MTNFDFDAGVAVAAVAAAIPATIAAIAALRNGKQNRSIEERLKDGNGDEQNIGQMVYELFKCTEVLQGEMHEMKRDVSNTLRSHREELLERIERLEGKSKRRK